jgi:polysaccharide biosynthesis transport protein
MASDSRDVASMLKRFLWTFLVMIPVSAVAGFLLAAVVTYVIPKMYQSEAVIEVKPRHPHGDMTHTMTPQFFGTEFEKIKSRNSLEQVVEKLELTNRWMIDKEAALQVLKRIVTTQNIRGTDLIAIRVRHTNKADARDIAQEVGEAYASYRKEIETRDAERQLAELDKAVRDQEDKVEERRKILSTIVRTKGIIYKGPDASYNSPADGEQQGAKDALQTYHSLEQEKMQIESQISSLLNYDGDQLMVYAAGLDLPDNLLRTRYPNYLEEKRNLAANQIKGMGDSHPAIIESRQRLETMKRQLDEAVVNLRATLTAQLDLTVNRLKESAITAEATRGAAIQRGLDAQDYVDAKRDFETDQDLLQTLKLKQVSEKISLKTPRDSVVIHEDAMISQSPVSPNVTLNLVLGTVAGLLLSPFIALPVAWLLHRSHLKRSAVPEGVPSQAGNRS